MKNVVLLRIQNNRQHVTQSKGFMIFRFFSTLLMYYVLMYYANPKKIVGSITSLKMNHKETEKKVQPQIFHL